MSSAVHLPNSIDSLIGPGVCIEGDVRSSGVVRVQGEIKGNVSCDAGPAAALVVDHAGTVTGNVSATHIAVNGRIVGPLQSTESIEIHADGAVAGDIVFRQLAIHAGGIIEGELKPLPAATGAGLAEVLRPHVAARRTPGGISVTPAARKAIAVVAVAGVVAAAWLARDAIMRRPAESQDVALRADTALREANAPPAEQAATPAVERPAAAVVAAPVTPAAAPAAAPEPARAESGDVEIVRGANPNRPRNVFLLVTHEPSVLYRKKRDDPGEGVRVNVPGNDRAGVSIAPDDLIRIAKGTNIEIFYQGQKVPRQLIVDGAWIAFAPR